MKLFLVLYVAGNISPVGIVDAPIGYAACIEAARHQTKVLQTINYGRYSYRCEERGPNDMIWHFHPEWRN